MGLAALLSRRTVGCAAVALILACAACRGSALAPGDADAIEAVLHAQAQAWNRGDIDGFMQGYVQDDSLVFTSGGAVRRGYAEALARYRERYVDAAAMGTLSFSELEITGLSGDAAVVLGRWALTDTPQAGHGVFTLVFVRSEGAWRVLHDHTSAAPPPTDDPAGPAGDRAQASPVAPPAAARGDG